LRRAGFEFIRGTPGEDCESKHEQRGGKNAGGHTEYHPAPSALFGEGIRRITRPVEWMGRPRSRELYSRNLRCGERFNTSSVWGRGRSVGAVLPTHVSSNKLLSLPPRPLGRLRRAISLRSVRRYVDGPLQRGANHAAESKTIYAALRNIAQCATNSRRAASTSEP